MKHLQYFSLNEATTSDILSFLKQNKSITIDSIEELIIDILDIHNIDIVIYSCVCTSTFSYVSYATPSSVGREEGYYSKYEFRQKRQIWNNFSSSIAYSPKELNNVHNMVVLRFKGETNFDTKQMSDRLTKHLLFKYEIISKAYPKKYNIRKLNGYFDATKSFPTYEIKPSWISFSDPIFNDIYLRILDSTITTVPFIFWLTPKL